MAVPAVWLGTTIRGMFQLSQKYAKNCIDKGKKAKPVQRGILLSHIYICTTIPIPPR